MVEQRFHTITAKPNAETLVKPGELVDLIEVTPLTLSDRRIYNQLLENAWDAIDKPVTHVIAKSALRGSHNSNDRVGESIERLMQAIVKLSVIWEGEAAIERVQLLGGNVELSRSDGQIYYEIPARLRKIIRNSTIFARLQREVMFALTSKYALTLYEMVQKRGNLKHKDTDTFTLNEFRGILGVPQGKLSTWSNLNNRAIKPAVEEVNALSDFIVEITPVKTGRSVTGVILRWWRKDGQGVAAAERGLSYASTGRKARAEGRVETVRAEGGDASRARPVHMDRLGAPLSSETYETARMRFLGYDIYFVEQEWRQWAAGKGEMRDPNKAFLAFFRTYAENHPL